MAYSSLSVSPTKLRQPLREYKTVQPSKRLLPVADLAKYTLCVSHNQIRDSSASLFCRGAQEFDVPTHYSFCLMQRHFGAILSG
jgi:hypothetical protein